MENMSIEEKQREQQHDQNMAKMSQHPGQPPPNDGSSERGSHFNKNNDEGIYVRNCESSIRNLTDQMISFSFG